MGGSLTFICCSKEKDNNATQIRETHEEKTVTAYRYYYAYATTPYVVQQPPLYHESMSQAPVYSVSKAPTVINQ